MYIASQTDRFNCKWANSELAKLANYWSAEFYDVKTELKISNELGGWLKRSSYSLSTALIDLDDIWEKYEHIVPYAYEVCRRNNGEPKPEYKTPATVRNHIYKGPAKKSEPRIQLLTLGTEDILSFYLRLTTFQRRFNKRMITSAVLNYKKRSKFKIQESMISNEPWYCIPDSLIRYTTWTNSGYGFTLEGESELYRRNNDPILSLLYGKYSEFDENMTWDPKVPHYALDKVINTSLYNYRACSQFSNTGALPILEYFYRNQIYPMPQLLPYGRVRMKPGDPLEDDIIEFRQPRGSKSHYEKCVTTFSYEEDDPVIPKEKDVDKGITILDIDNALNEFEELKGKRNTINGSILTNNDINEKSETELLDKLLNYDDTEYDHKERDELPNMIFDGSDEEMDFNLLF